MAQHAQLRVEAGLAVYFYDPHSPWQRGTKSAAGAAADALAGAQRQASAAARAEQR